MRQLQWIPILAAFCLAACVSSPLPLAGGQVLRDRACQWQHLELHLVLDPGHEHLKGTARLHVRAFTASTSSITLDLGAMRLSGAVLDSAGRELELTSIGGSLRQVLLAGPLARGEEEVLELRFDATPGPGLRFEPGPTGDWVHLTGGAFFPHIAGHGHFPTMDVTLFADGESNVVGPGQPLPASESAVGATPFHFRVASPMDPEGLHLLAGPLVPVELSGADLGWCLSSDLENSKIWTQAWMRARATDVLPGPGSRVAFLPQDSALNGWQGGWVAIPMVPNLSVPEVRAICRGLVIEQNILRGMLPDSIQGRALMQAFVQQAQLNEGLQPTDFIPNRMQRGLQAMRSELGPAPYKTLRDDFLELQRGHPLNVWEWARFAEYQTGLSAQALYETLTGR